jgi:arginase
MESDMLKIFGCPMHWGVGDKGLMGSLDFFMSLYPDIPVELIDEKALKEEGLLNLKNLNSVVKTCDDIAGRLSHCRRAGDFPLFLGGDHSCAMGTIGAAAEKDGGLGLVWIDAHPDINTHETTVTGNIHGMPVAAMLGLGDERLVRIGGAFTKLRPENVVMIGLRDIDPPEKETLKRLNIKYYTYWQAEEAGLARCAEEAAEHLRRCKSVHVSFDIDVTDPKLFPGVSVPVPEGFTGEESVSLIRDIMGRLPVKSFDIVEYNTAHDEGCRTAELMKKLIYTVKNMAE